MEKIEELNIKQEFEDILNSNENEYHPINWKKNMMFFGKFVEFNTNKFTNQQGTKIEQIKSACFKGKSSINPNEEIKLRISTLGKEFLPQLKTFEVDKPCNKDSIYSIHCIRINNKGYPVFVVRLRIDGKWLTTNQYLTELENHSN